MLTDMERFLLGITDQACSDQSESSNLTWTSSIACSPFIASVLTVLYIIRTSNGTRQNMRPQLLTIEERFI